MGVGDLKYQLELMQTYDFSDCRLTACGDTAGQTGCKDQSRVWVWVGGLVDSRQVTPQAESDNLLQRHRLRGGGGWDGAKGKGRWRAGVEGRG